jgi:hypothetical protein
MFLRILSSLFLENLDKDIDGYQKRRHDIFFDALSLQPFNLDFCIDKIIGINCYDELLLRSELITYASTNFSQDIKENRINFFSKRLNLYVY